MQNIEKSFDTFLSVMLQFPEKSGKHPENLKSLISMVESEKQIKDGFCSACGKDAVLTKTSFFYQMPSILCLVLKRFKLKKKGKKKNQSKVVIPLIMSHKGLNIQITSDPKTSHVRFPTYNLASVVTHSGNLSSGHYTW